MVSNNSDLTISDVKNIVIAVSNQISFLLSKKILKYATSFFDFSLYNLDELRKNYTSNEDLLLFFLNEFFLEPIEKKFDQEISLKRKKEILDEYKFVSQEINAIIDLYEKTKLSRKKEEEQQYTLKLSSFL